MDSAELVLSGAGKREVELTLHLLCVVSSRKFKNKFEWLVDDLEYYRIVGVEGDLWGSFSPTPLLKQFPTGGYTVNVRADFEHLRRRRLHGLSGQPVPVLCHSQGSFFLMFIWNFLCFILCPLPPVLLLGTAAKSLAPST